MENNNEVQTSNNQVHRLNLNYQPMLLKDWINTYLLLLIPIVNIVLMFIWAFGKNVNQSKKTFFQAQLIFSAAVLVLYVVFFGTIISSFLGTRGY